MSPDGSTVLFRELPTQFSFELNERRRLRAFAARLTRQAGGQRPFSCIITSDEELRRLNQQFRGKDQPTDVLSFPAGDDGEHLGDIAISIERAAEQAHEYGHGLLEELSILMLHGFLHLQGFDHERDSGEMARAEEQWRQMFNLPNNLIARAEYARGWRS